MIARQVAKRRGVSYISVLNEWKAISDTALDLGTKTHKWIEDYYNGENPEYPEDPILLDRVNKFEDLGYTVQYKILNSVNFKVPQERRRVFIVGTLNGYSFIYPKESNKRISMKEAIDDLPKLSSGEKSNIPLHFAMNHSEQMLKKMSYISNGGTRIQIPVN
jgi:site-specific DNA-cytosine methylase